MRPWCIVWLCAAVSTCGLSRAAADEPQGSEWRSLLPENAAVILEVPALADLARDPVLAAAWEALTSLRSVAPLVERPESQAFYDVLAQLEQRVGVSSTELLGELTAQGVAAALTSDTPPRRVVIARGADEARLQALLAAVREIVAQATGQPLDAIPVGEHRGWKGIKLGDLLIGVGDGQLVAASHRDLLERTIDACIARGTAAGAHGASPHAGPPRARLQIDLTAFREIPDVKKSLAWPADDPGAVAILGGWLDLLRRFDQVALDWEVRPVGPRLTTRFSNPREGLVTPGLEGFFAAPTQSAAPLLAPPGAIYSASWFRDYGALWGARATILGEQRAAELSQQDADAGKQSAVVGATFSPSELFSQLGPQFRVVVLEPGESPYAEVSPPNRLPGAVAVVGLKDERRVREWVAPVIRIFSLILVGDQGMGTTMSVHRGVELQVLSQKTTADALRRGGLDRFNFRVTFAFVPGAFVIGTTPSAVQAAVDELLEPAAAEASADAAPCTERQRMSFAALAAALPALHEALRRGLVLQQGLTPDDADHDVQVLTRLAERWGEFELSCGYSDQEFIHEIDWRTTSPASRPAAVAR